MLKVKMKGRLKDAAYNYALVKEGKMYMTDLTTYIVEDSDYEDGVYEVIGNSLIPTNKEYILPIVEEEFNLMGTLNLDCKTLLEYVSKDDTKPSAKQALIGKYAYGTDGYRLVSLNTGYEGKEFKIPYEVLVEVVGNKVNVTSVYESKNYISLNGNIIFNKSTYDFPKVQSIKDNITEGIGYTLNLVDNHKEHIKRYGTTLKLLDGNVFIGSLENKEFKIHCQLGTYSESGSIIPNDNISIFMPIGIEGEGIFINYKFINVDLPMVLYKDKPCFQNINEKATKQVKKITRQQAINALKLVESYLGYSLNTTL